MAVEFGWVRKFSKVFRFSVLMLVLRCAAGRIVAKPASIEWLLFINS